MRRSAVEALCTAITDKHTSAVPTGVLILILKNVVLPTASWLGQDLVQSVSEGTWSSDEVVEENSEEFKVRSDLYSPTATAVLSSAASTAAKYDPAATRLGITSHLLTVITDVRGLRIFHCVFADAVV